MNIIEFNAPIFVSKLEAHTEIRESVIKAIDDMGRFSYTVGTLTQGQRITHTDWHLGRNFKRAYWDIAAPHMDKINRDVCNHFGLISLKTRNYWFQWYEQGDFHALHAHHGCMFSNVYYVQLSEAAPKTRFKLNGQSFEVDVSEGDVITFPSFLMHESIVNTSSDTKIVIAFNTDVVEGY